MWTGSSLPVTRGGQAPCLPDGVNKGRLRVGTSPPCPGRLLSGSVFISRCLPIRHSENCSMLRNHAPPLLLCLGLFLSFQICTRNRDPHAPHPRAPEGSAWDVPTTPEEYSVLYAPSHTPVHELDSPCPPRAFPSSLSCSFPYPSPSVPVVCLTVSRSGHRAIREGRSHEGSPSDR